MRKSLLTILGLSFLFAFSSCSLCGGDLSGSSGDGTGNYENSTETDESENDANETTFLVVFDSNGGTEIPSQTIDEGKKAVRPDNPTRASTSTKEYAFMGWYLGELEWSFENEVSSDMTLVAKWEVTQYTVEMLPSK